MGKARLQPLEAGINYLRSVQLRGGNFDSFSSPSRIKFVADKTYSSTFGPSLILAALAAVPEAQNIRNKLAAWLQGQKSPFGSYNYWSADSPERKKLPYPDDLDDTFCALVGIYLHDSSIIDGNSLAQAVKLLIATETAPGGPYRTWLVPETVDKAWLDVDLAVNANVAYFLSLAAEPLPNLTRLMEKAIDDKKFYSPYYPDVYPLIYYISRAYDGSKRRDLVRYILSLRRSNGTWGTPMHTALMMTSLIRLGKANGLERAKSYLLDTQLNDGSWPAEAFCLDPALDGKKYYGGSSVLGTAFALEALRMESRSTDNHTVNASDRRRVAVLKKVFKQADVTFASLDQQLHGNIAGLLKKFRDSDTGKDAVLLPYLFYASLLKPNKFNERTFINLGLANLYGWLAYTIYDDFLDDEGNPLLLPAANIAMRESVRLFHTVRDTDFLKLVGETFNTIDIANNWEVTNCRFKINGSEIKLGKLPEWGMREKLAERSIGHALTPLAVLAQDGFKVNGSEAKHVLEAIRHFLIARQLNDDLHDWQDDLSRGHITYVAAEVLKGMKFRQKTVDLSRMLPTLQKQFWHETILEVCGVITLHTSTSRQALASCRSLKDENVISTLLDGIDKVNDETLKTVADAKDFLKAYSGKH